MDKNSLIDQIWLNRTTNGFRGTKSSLKSMEIDELQQLLAQPEKGAENQGVDNADNQISVVKTEKGVEIPVVHLPLLRVSSSALIFQFGEKEVMVRNQTLLLAVKIDKSFSIGQTAPFNFSLGVNSFKKSNIPNFLTQISEGLSESERKEMGDDVNAGKLLTSFIPGLNDSLIASKETQAMKNLLIAKELQGKSSAVQKAVKSALLEDEVSELTKKLKSLLG